MAQTSDTLGKLKASGVVTMGVREASGVLSYSTGVGQYIGYQIDICRRIIANIETAIGRKLETKFQLVTSQNRIPLVANGTVDLECGSTTNNLARQASVAFVNTTFVEPVRMLVKVNSGINSIADLNGKTVVTTTGGTTVQLLRKNKKAENIQFTDVFGKDHADSFLLLENGRADAFAMDNSLIAGLRARSKSPEAYKIVGESMSTEPIAIVIAKGDPAFKKIADDTVVQMSRSGEMTKLYEKWFMQPTPPANVVIGLPMSDEMKTLIANPNDKPVEEYQKP
ncbi:transporter substrate-binding domain-containing protein [Variovorax boronicumulans]